MSNEQREAIIVPEKKEKIERIKRKYNNPNMDDKTASKIRALEVTNNILLGATSVVGVATIINYFVPDMLPFIDEIVMTGATTLLGSATAIVNNKIKDLAETGTTDVKYEEVQKISGQMQQVAKAVANKRNATKGVSK